MGSLTIPLIIGHLLIYELSSSAKKITQKPTCNTSMVTRNCDFFREHSSEIVINFPDGSSLVNPLFHFSGEIVIESDDPLPSNNPAGNGTQVGNGYGTNPQDYDKYLYLQSEIVDALSEVPFSTKFKMSYANLATTTIMNPSLSVSLPWPPEDKNASPKSVPISEINSYLQKRLPAPNYARIQTAATEMARPYLTQMAENQKRQQELMAKEKQRLEEETKETNLRNKKKNALKNCLFTPKIKFSRLFKEDVLSISSLPPRNPPSREFVALN